MASNNDNFNEDTIAALKSWAINIAGPGVDTTGMSYNNQVVYLLKTIVEGS